jgi:hypothetical protein
MCMVTYLTARDMDNFKSENTRVVQTKKVEPVW